MARTPLLTVEQRAEIAAELSGLSLLRVAGKSVAGADLLIRALSRKVSTRLPVDTDPLADGQLIYCELYEAFLLARGRSPEGAQRSAIQSWRSASGNFFQEYIKDQTNAKTSQKGLIAVTARDLRAIEKSKSLISFLELPAKRRCLQSSISVWPDNDIILITRNEERAWRAVGILSCKTSLRERTFESAFWTLATRDTGLRSGFITADLDDELDSCGGTGKNRQIIETYFDRAYSTNPSTRYCSQVRPFREVETDLLRWQLDVVAGARQEPLRYTNGSWLPSDSLASSQ